MRSHFAVSLCKIQKFVVMDVEILMHIGPYVDCHLRLPYIHFDQCQSRFNDPCQDLSFWLSGKGFYGFALERAPQQPFS
jgi:hypothetical protein